jgi:hypothetical protein
MNNGRLSGMGVTVPSSVVAANKAPGGEAATEAIKM